MRATTVLIPTVAPSSTSTSASVPAAGGGVSVSTLSVESSHNGPARHHRLGPYRGPLFDQPFGQRAGGGRGDFRLHLGGRDLEQRLVALHPLAGLLQPLSQGPFDNALAHLGHHYVGHINSLFPQPRERKSRTAFRNRKRGQNARLGRATPPPCWRARPVAPSKLRTCSSRTAQCTGNSSDRC